MDPRREPDEIDPSNQSGRPVMVSVVILGILVVLALLIGVYFLAT
jgi:cobalamin biosynthesis Mg chelatase CobN